jgi:hypothetical protein
MYRMDGTRCTLMSAATPEVDKSSSSYFAMFWIFGNWSPSYNQCRLDLNVNISFSEQLRPWVYDGYNGANIYLGLNLLAIRAKIRTSRLFFSRPTAFIFVAYCNYMYSVVTYMYLSQVPSIYFILTKQFFWRVPCSNNRIRRLLWRINDL